MSDYGAHCERLAGEGVHSGELRDYESFQEQDARSREQRNETGEGWQFIKFGSHRARDYGLRALQRKPQGYFSCRRETGVGGVYKVTEAEIRTMRGYSRHARFTILRAPYDDLMETWSFACPQTEASTTAETSTEMELDQTESACQFFDELERRNPTGEI